MTTTRHSQSDILPLDHTGYTAQLFRTSQFSDCTIQSNHRVWHLHRCILSPRCEFFWSCFQGPFEEAGSATVEMHDDDPETLERMIRWIYQLEYPALPSEEQRQEAWTRDLTLYMMADKYGLGALMDATRQALLQTAEKCASRTEVFLGSVDDFVDVMQMLYVDFPEREDLVTLRETLLDIVSPAVAKHMRHVPILEELMTSIPKFGVALVESLAQQKQSRRRSSSPLESLSVGSGSLQITSRGNSPSVAKPHIPLNEDSEDELE